MRFSDLGLRAQSSLVLRFVLEMAAVAGFAAAPALLLDTWTKWLLVAAAPFLTWSLWGLFTTPGDPAKAGRKQQNDFVPTPGPLRMLIELVLFLGAAAVMAWAGVWWLTWAVIAVTAVQIALWPERTRWLLKH